MTLMSSQWLEVKVQPVVYIQRPNHFDTAVKCGHGDYIQILPMDSASHWVAVHQRCQARVG